MPRLSAPACATSGTRDVTALLSASCDATRTRTGTGTGTETTAADVAFTGCATEAGVTALDDATVPTAPPLQGCCAAGRPRAIGSFG